MSSRWISISLSGGASFRAAWRRRSACAALTSELLPMPRAPQRSALLAGRPAAKRCVLSIRMSRERSMPLRSGSATRLTFDDGLQMRRLGVPDEGLCGAEIGRHGPPAAPAAPALRRSAPERRASDRSCPARAHSGKSRPAARYHAKTPRPRAGGRRAGTSGRRRAGTGRRKSRRFRRRPAALRSAPLLLQWRPPRL